LLNGWGTLAWSTTDDEEEEESIDEPWAEERFIDWLICIWFLLCCIDFERATPPLCALAQRQRASTVATSTLRRRFGSTADAIKEKVDIAGWNAESAAGRERVPPEKSGKDITRSSIDDDEEEEEVEDLDFDGLEAVTRENKDVCLLDCCFPDPVPDPDAVDKGDVGRGVMFSFNNRLDVGIHPRIPYWVSAPLVTLLRGISTLTRNAWCGLGGRQIEGGGKDVLPPEVDDEDIDEEVDDEESISYQIDFILIGFCEADKTAPPLVLAWGKLGEICVQASSLNSFARSSWEDEIPHNAS
jgi:hypothetical protein